MQLLFLNRGVPLLTGIYSVAVKYLQSTVVQAQQALLLCGILNINLYCYAWNGAENFEQA